MATKTIINCLDQQQSTSVNSVALNQTNSQHQGISIKIDPTAGGGGPSATGIVIPNYSGASSAALVSNVIKIQHSCQTTGHGTTLTNLNGNEVASNKTNNNNNTNNNNKLLIDINRKQTTISDSYGNDDWNPSACLATPTPSSSSLSSSSSSAVIQVKCSTSNPTDFLPLSREMSTEKPLEIAILANGNGNLRESKMESMRDDDDHVVRESHKESGPKSNNFNNESNQTSHTATTITNTTTTTTITKTTTQQLTSQQVNGNKEENNGHCSLNQTNSKRQTTNGQENQGNDETNFKPHNEDHNEHHYEAEEHNKADHDDHNNDGDDDCGLKFVSGIGKRGDSGLDIIVSHGKRWPAKENSNSLLTQADTATTPQLHSRQATTSVIIGENFYWKKENSQECGENTGKTPPTASAAAHVVKIQINPQNNNKPITPAPNSAVEKQISIVKIENEVLLENHNNENTKENPKESEVNSSEAKNKADQENQKEISEDNEENGKSRKSELHLNLEKMVQKSQNNSSVTVSSAGGGGSNTSITTPSLAPNSSAGHNSELNVTNPSYLYYSTMSSGQFSPCDTLDSGTGSDLESQNHTPHTPTAHLLLPPSKKPSANGLEMHLKTTKVRVSSSQHGSNKDPRNCNSSSYTDSEESEASSLSCDSLHSSEFMRQSSQSPIQNKIPSPSRKILGSFLPDSLLRDIKNLKLNNTEYEAENENEEDEDHIEQRIKAHKQRQSESYEPISSQDYMMAQNDFVQTRNTENSSSTNVAKRASLPSKTFVLNQEDGTFIDMKMNSMPRKYEADKYYNFHVNEHENFRSFGNNNTNNGGSGFSESGSESLAEYDGRNSLNDDVFAGYKDLRCGSATSTIRSNKGTVRGVKNRVRNGIATFLQLQQPNMKNFKEKDSGKVVLYTTSMGIIRDTYAKCSNVKKILRTLLVKFEERDVFMSVEYQQEIKERMHSEIIKVPQLFVEGQHIGDAETVERLNESGELRQLLKPYKSIATTYTCQTCGGYRLLPCPSCKGSKKSVHRNHFTAEFVALKCMNCDEVGLVKCHNC